MQQIIVLQYKTGILKITYRDTILHINCTCMHKYVRTVSLYIHQSVRVHSDTYRLTIKWVKNTGNVKCYLNMTDNFLLHNVSQWENYEELHFVQDATPPYWHVYVLPPGYFVWPCSPHIHRTEFVTSHNEQKTKAIKCGACASCYKYFVWPCSPHIHRTEFVMSQNEQKESFQQYFYNWYRIVVYTGLRSDSIKNHASRNKAHRIAAMRIIFTRIGCTLLTCDIYMSDLRHIHDPVLSSLKMEGIRFFFCAPISCMAWQQVLRMVEWPQGPTEWPACNFFLTRWTNKKP
jgi:hypothetical protein